MFPDMFSLAQAHQAFGEDGRLLSEKLGDHFDRTAFAFMDLAEAAKRYPCAKKAWVEFLGEQPTRETERVE